MNTKFRNILFSTMLGVAGLATTGCTDLDEHLYDTIATENHEFTNEEIMAMFGPVYSSLRDVYWGWYSYADMMDQSSDVWCIPYRIGIGWGDLYVSMHKHEFHSQIAHFNDTWTRNYAGINACNKLLGYQQIQENPKLVAQLRGIVPCITIYFLTCSAIFLWIQNLSTLMVGYQSKLSRRRPLISWSRN